MNSFSRLAPLAAVLIMMGCSEKRSEKGETVLTGKATILVEESLLPITEDVAMVFESQYDAKLTLVPRSETEIVNALQNGKATIAVLPRRLDSTELRAFHSKKVFPRVTPFGSDALALIRKATATDTLIDIETLMSLMQGKVNGSVKGLVFDNLNSGAARQLMAMAGVASLPENGIYSFTTNGEVIRYVAENDGMIGVVGINWLSQPSDDYEPLLDKIKVLKVKGKDGYYGPSQSNIAEGKYPLARDLFVVNSQSYQGLGIGFASFIAGERGQRIILKSGLLPVRIPSRKIVTRPGILKNNNQ